MKNEFRNHHKSFGCCGPGRKRYLLAFLCTLGLTIVIGMRSEMLGIISKLKNQSDAKSHEKIFKPSEHRKLPWTEPFMEDFVENSVFFAYMIASPIGGYLTVNHDSSLLFGSSVAMTCGINLFLPLVETISQDITAKILMIILLRILQGLAEGCLIPAMFGVLRFWTPFNERSTIICFSVIGVSLGPLIGLPVCVRIEEKWGWGVVFYIYANLGLIWCIFWWRLIDEKPTKDESLSNYEKNFLIESIESKVLNVKRQLKIPWKHIIKSRPIYAILFTYAADDWTFQIASVCMQAYYQQQYNSDIDKTIFLLSFPFLARSLFVPIGGVLADVIGLKTSWSWTHIRKLLTGLGFGLKGIFFFAMGFAQDEKTATVLLSLCLGFSGLAVSGYAVNVVEIAPNYAGLIMGMASGVSTFTGIGSTVIASLVVHHIKSQGWRIALCLAAATQFFSMFMYLWFGSSDEELWAFEQNSNPISTNKVVISLDTNTKEDLPISVV